MRWSDKANIVYRAKDTCTNANVQHADLINEEKLHPDNLRYLLIGSFAEIKLAFVVSIKAKCIMQCTHAETCPWLFDVGCCYEHYLP